MKNVSAKKIVLSSIALFSCIMLFVGLSFRLVFFKIALLSGSASSAVSETIGLEANGFTMLSFKMPALLKEGMLECLKTGAFDFFEILLAISSWLVLAYSIIFVIFTLLGFFLYETKKNEKMLKWLIVGSLLIAVVYSVSGIVCASVTQSCMKKVLTEEDIVGDFATAAYASLIIQTVCLIAFLVCLKAVKEPQTAVLASEDTAESKKEGGGDKAAALKELVSIETEIVNLISEYKGLYDEQIISTADYMDKKVKLIKYSEKHIKSTVVKLIEKSGGKGVVAAEGEVVCALKAYAKLLKDGVISDSDFVEKKVSLLNYVIG